MVQVEGDLGSPLSCGIIIMLLPKGAPKPQTAVTVGKIPRTAISFASNMKYGSYLRL